VPLVAFAQWWVEQDRAEAAVAQAKAAVKNTKRVEKIKGQK
jgi:hypothetical protein